MFGFTPATRLLSLLQTFRTTMTTFLAYTTKTCSGGCYNYAYETGETF